MPPDPSGPDLNPAMAGAGRAVRVAVGAAAVLLLLLAAQVLPQQAGAQPPPGALPGAGDDNREAARALGEALGVAAQAGEVLAEIRADLLTRTMHQSGKWETEAAAVVDDLLMPAFAARTAELQAALLEPWAAGFTPRELRLLRSFFASPLGRHYLRVQPSLARQASQNWHDWSERVFRDTIDNRGAELRARGVRF